MADRILKRTVVAAPCSDVMVKRSIMVMFLGAHDAITRTTFRHEVWKKFENRFEAESEVRRTLHYNCATQLNKVDGQVKMLAM